MACRTGCPTGGHKTWGDCARAANLQVPTQESQQHSGQMSSRAWDREISSYREARAQGIQPKSTRQADIDFATKVSQAADRPFDATKGTFA